MDYLSLNNCPMSSTLADLRVSTRETYVKIDPNAKVWSDNILDIYINSAYEKIQKDFQYSMPECETSTTITTIWWVELYAKPSDFIRIIGLYEDTYNLTRTTKQQTMIAKATESKPSSYYLFWQNIGLYPIPDNAYSIDFLYNRKLPKLTSTQDSELPEEYDELINLYAAYLMLISVEKTQKAASCLGQYILAKDSLFWAIMYDDDSIDYAIQRSMDRVRDDAL